MSHVVQSLLTPHPDTWVSRFAPLVYAGGTVLDLACGNGRHARMMADLLIQKLGQPRFTWGSKSLTEATETRISYIDSLRAADIGNIQPLLAFVRS